MSNNTTVKFFPNRIITFCIAIIMMASAATCLAQETEQFKLVKNVSELKDGDIVIIVNNTNEHCSALSKNLNNYKTLFYGFKIDINEEIIAAPSDVNRIQLKKNEKQWLLLSMAHQQYICNNSNKREYCNLLALRNADDNLFDATAKTNISITNNFATINYPQKSKSQTTYYERNLAFNYFYDQKEPNTVGYYNCYKPINVNQNVNHVQIYKKIPIILKDEDDNTNTLNKSNGNPTPVILSRTLLADTWNTFCVPFDIDLKDGKINGTEVNVMEYDNTTDHTINFKNATKIEAGKAYLIKPTTKIVNPQFNGITIKNVTPIVSGDPVRYSFVGLYSPITFNDSNKDRILILSKEGKFLSVKKGDKMKGMRAYFTIPPKTKAEAVRLMINNKPTAITEISTTLSSPEKIFYTDGTYAGTDIKKVKKGIVIKGGKKILVK